MAELSIIPVNTAEDLDRFVELPWSIYTPDSLWVPNLKKQDRELLSPGEHPFWKTARRELFLALRDGRPLGRIAAIVDEKYNAYAGERCGAFGFFECRDDHEAAHALLQGMAQLVSQQSAADRVAPAEYISAEEHIPACGKRVHALFRRLSRGAVIGVNLHCGQIRAVVAAHVPNHIGAAHIFSADISGFLFRRPIQINPFAHIASPLGFRHTCPPDR